MKDRERKEQTIQSEKRKKEKSLPPPHQPPKKKENKSGIKLIWEEYDSWCIRVKFALGGCRQK